MIAVCLFLSMLGVGLWSTYRIWKHIAVIRICFIFCLQIGPVPIYHEILLIARFLRRCEASEGLTLVSILLTLLSVSALIEEMSVGTVRHCSALVQRLFGPGAEAWASPALVLSQSATLECGVTLC